MAGKKRKQQTTQRHLQPLSSDFDTSSVSSSKKRSRPPKLHQQEHKLISSDLSSKILKEALNQQKEILEEETQPQTLTSFSSIPPNHSIASDSGAESDDDVDAFDGSSETLSHYDAPPEEIDEEDEKVLAAFMSKDAGPQRTLADLIIQRIKEKEAQVTSEYGMGGEVSTFGDIYSYGILLLEIFTGKKPTDEIFNGSLSLHQFAKLALPEQVMEIVDQSLLLVEFEGLNESQTRTNAEGRLEMCLVSIISVGVACSMISIKDRMKIGDAMVEMLGIRDLYLGVGRNS